MRAFMESRERFVFRLRPLDVIEAIRLSGVCEIPDPEQIDAALARLCEWGNLCAVIDRAYRSRSGTVGALYERQQSFQLTEKGEAAENALAGFETAASTSGLEGLQDTD